MFTAFPGLPAKSPSLWTAGDCCGAGQTWGFLCKENVDRCFVPGKHAHLARLQWCFYKIKIRSVNLDRGQVLKGTTIFVPFFGELFLFLVQNNKNWLYLSLPLLSRNILPHAKNKQKIHVLMYLKNKHLHLGKNLITLFLPPLPLPFPPKPFPLKRKKEKKNHTLSDRFPTDGNSGFLEAY